MSPKGRPKGESAPKRVSAEGRPASPKGRPKGESAPKRVSAEGRPASPKGRPKGESAPKRVSAEGRPARTDPFALDGRVALVTGAGSGLGFAIARGLAAAGARVAINGRDRAKLDAAAVALASEGWPVHVAPFDVADAGAVAAGVSAVADALGPIEILVNNAAVNRRGPLDTFSEDDWRALMAANVDGPFFVTRAVLPSMKARRAGKIVNICSLASDLGRPNIVPYAVSKGGLKQLTRALAVELAPHGIQVNGIAPGFFDTPMNAPLVADAEFSAWVSRRTPAGRWGRPDEIAGAAVFLASPAASYVTGAILHVDGGFAAAY